MTEKELVEKILNKMTHAVTLQETKIARAEKFAAIIRPILKGKIEIIDYLLDKLFSTEDAQTYTDRKIEEKSAMIFEKLMEELEEIQCAISQTTPDPDCLYIVAFDEIFSEIESEAERELLLNNLNSHLADSLLSDQSVYIDFNNELEKLENLIAQTDQYLGSDNFISDTLRQQKDRNSFFRECKLKDAITILIGGVFGDACVWAITTELAANIFSKTIPFDSITHVNIRFTLPQVDYQFQNAIIKPDITQGHMNCDKLFSRYVIFTETLRLNRPVKDYESPVFYETEELKLMIAEKLKTLEPELTHKKPRHSQKSLVSEVLASSPFFSKPAATVEIKEDLEGEKRSEQQLS